METKQSDQSDVSIDEAEQAVVISGISGNFPKSENLEEFRNNLFNKVDLLDNEPLRWEHVHPEIPTYSGKVRNIDKFDADFFGFRKNHVNQTDPQLRLLLEKTYECVLDAGLSLQEFHGSRTGVFISCFHSETEKYWFSEEPVEKSNVILGNMLSLVGGHISYFYNLQGPAVTVDSACASSFYAMHLAQEALRNGTCDFAIVGASNLCLMPVRTLQFARLGALSYGLGCKSFDHSRDGYTRSDSIVSVFLQRRNTARRVYARLIHLKLSCDGYKDSGLSRPSKEDHMKLYQHTYNEAEVDIRDVSFVEAHATGTKAGDKEELSGIHEVFCQNRNTPLYIGSVKSSVGHTEAASGLVSLVKVILAMESGMIPPNLRYTIPMDGFPCLLDGGALKVITEPTSWPCGNVLVGINNFGFGGSNGHAILEWNKVEKQISWSDDMLRLVCVSGRTTEAVHHFLDNISETHCNTELIKLVHDIFRYDIRNHDFRGFSILSKHGEIFREIGGHENFQTDFKCLFGDVIENIDTTLHSLTRFQDITNILNKMDDIISSNNLQCPSTYNKHYNDTIGTIKLHLIIITLLNKLQLKPSRVYGYSIGEISCGYFAEILNLEQTIIIAHCIATVKYGCNSAKLLTRLNKIVTESVSYKTWISVDDDFKNIPNKMVDFSTYFVEAVFKKPKRDLSLNRIKSTAFNIGYLEKVHMKFNRKVDYLIMDDLVQSILTSIGRLYNLGLNCNLSSLYPDVKYPVSRGTPMLSPMIKWDHRKSWFVHSMKSEVKIPENIFRIIIDINYDYWKFLYGHIIDGRILFPMTGYIHLALSGYAIMTKRIFHELKVVMKNVKSSKIVSLRENSPTCLTVSIHRGTGYYEILEKEDIVATGEIYDDLKQDYFQEAIPETFYDGESLLLNMDDVYKEFRLRGYEYNDAFKGIEEYSPTVSKLLWQSNWIAFVDGFIQMKYLQQDSRSLEVPTSIDKLLLDSRRFYSDSKLVDGHTVNVYSFPELDIFRTEYILVQGIHSATVSRRNLANVPILESYEFVANEGERTIDEAMRINAQIIVENCSTARVRAMEIYHEGAGIILSNHLEDTLNDIPRTVPDISVYSSNTNISELRASIRIENKLDTNLFLVLGHNLLKSKHELLDIKSRITSTGFLLSLENEFTKGDIDMALITRFSIGQRCLLLFKNIPITNYTPTMFTLSDKQNWLPKLQAVLAKDQRSVLYSKGTSDNGILGLVNCLKQEPQTKLVKCVYIMDEANIPEESLKQQLVKDLAINVYKSGGWGTYRHLSLKSDLHFARANVQLTTKCPGDLSNLQWVEIAMESHNDFTSGRKMIDVCYAALNFKDILLASGRLTSERVTQNRLKKHFLPGLDFAGVDEQGQRVMGMVEKGSVSNRIIADPFLLWKIPPHWTMEDAATIPTVYSTVLYSFTCINKMKPRDSILIHAGAGGVGLSAINICLHLELEIFVTVGTEEKRLYIIEKFPKIKPTHIGHSRNSSFEQLVKKETSGKGVDYVLNSLADNLQKVSISCLAQGGTYLEIGKADLLSDHPFHMELLDKQANFHGIMLDLICQTSPKLKLLIRDIMQKYLDKGWVVPLDRKTFTMTEVESAFRFMASGKHIGKVVIKMKGNIGDSLYPCRLKYYCDSQGVYIIFGGLGGFAMEFVDWLVLRGARKIVLVSRSDVTTGYQNYRIRIWKSYGVLVVIRKNTCATEESCRSLFEEIRRYGDIIGIFNLAAALKDGLFANLKNEDYDICFLPKIEATTNLDKLSREYCPHLKQFVVFSTASCGRGNPGQTNYGMANSYMERLCERRKKEGLPALAIQWGAVADVGLIAEKMKERATATVGTLLQPVSNCLEIMDIFMTQDKPIVASMIIAQNMSCKFSESLVTRIARIIGLQKIESVSMHSTFPSLGMDSIMVEEIKQTLEVDYDIVVTAQVLRSMTFSELLNLSEVYSHKKNVAVKEWSFRDDVVTSMLQFANNDGTKIAVSKHKTSIDDDIPAENVIILPGMEGSSERMFGITAMLKKHAYAYHNLLLQSNEQNVTDIAESVLMQLRSKICGKTFSIIAHSYGVIIALEIAVILEREGLIGKLALIDSSPEFGKKAHDHAFNSQIGDAKENLLVTTVMSKFISTNELLKLKDELLNCKCFDDRLATAQKYHPMNATLSAIQVIEILDSAMRKTNLARSYNFSSTCKLNSTLNLYRTKIDWMNDLPEDYGLSEITIHPVGVAKYEGDHSSILNNADLICDIATFIE